MEIRRMLAGANHYYQGVDILEKVGEEASKNHWKRVLVLGGNTALQAAWPKVERGLTRFKISYTVHCYSGFNTAADISSFAQIFEQEGCNGIVGIGGGKIMDLAKAVAALVSASVFCHLRCLCPSVCNLQ